MGASAAGVIVSVTLGCDHADPRLCFQAERAPPVNSLASNNRLQNETHQTELGGRLRGRLWKGEINRVRKWVEAARKVQKLHATNRWPGHCRKPLWACQPETSTAALFGFFEWNRYVEARRKWCEWKRSSLNKYFLRVMWRGKRAEEKPMESVGEPGAADCVRPRPQEASEHNINREHVCYWTPPDHRGSLCSWPKHRNRQPLCVCINMYVCVRVCYSVCLKPQHNTGKQLL